MPPLLTTEEVADILFVSQKRVYELVDQGDLVAVRIDGVIRVPRNRVLSLVGQENCF